MPGADPAILPGDETNDQALALGSDNLGALTYLGEMQVQLGRMAAAQALLARPERACPTGCEELDEPREAFAAAP